MPPAHLPTFPWYRRALVPMFGLGNRKVLKYSAIETSLSLDVEDTVTCFCRSVSGLSRFDVKTLSVVSLYLVYMYTDAVVRHGDAGGW
ncbi:hypothetical protein ACS0PU_008933 [Formica fusca]